MAISLNNTFYLIYFPLDLGQNLLNKLLRFACNVTVLHRNVKHHKKRKQIFVCAESLNQKLLNCSCSNMALKCQINPGLDSS